MSQPATVAATGAPGQEAPAVATGPAAAATAPGRNGPARGRQPLRMAPLAQRAAALLALVVIGAGLAGLAMQWGPSEWGPSELLGFSLFFVGPSLLLAAHLLRPGRLAARLLDPLAPRVPGLALPSAGLLPLRLRNSLVQALGWLAGLAWAWAVLLQAPSVLAERLHDSALEGRADLLAGLVALAGAGLFGIAMHGLPARWARRRLAGQIDGSIASASLAHAADTLPVALLSLGFAPLLTPSDQDALPPLVLLSLPAAVLWWSLHAWLRLALARPAPARAGLWLVLLPPAGGSVAAKPLEPAVALALQCAADWPHGPITVVLPAGARAGGEHQLAARQTGQLQALAPRLTVQLSDWQRSLPPAAAWAALPLRELHLPPRWMADAVGQLLAADDRLIVVNADSAHQPAAWRVLLRNRPGSLVPAADADSRSAMRTLVRQLLPALRPASSPAVVPLPAAGPQPPALAGPADGTASPLPPWPQHRGPMLAGGLLLAMLVAGWQWLLARPDDRSQQLAQRLDALWQDSTPADPDTVAGTLRLQLAMATTTGQLQVDTARPGAVTLTLPADMLFAAGSAVLRPAVLPLLRQVAQALAQQSGTVEVTGHSDGDPASAAVDAEDRSRRTQRQATAVAAALRDGGVPDSRLAQPAGAGDAQPLAPGTSAEARARNRRVEIVLRTRPAGAVAPPAAPGSSAGQAAGAADAAAPSAPDATASTVAPNAASVSAIPAAAEAAPAASQ